MKKIVIVLAGWLLLPTALIAQQQVKSMEADEDKAREMAKNFCNMAVPIYDELIEFVKSHRKDKEDPPEPPDIEDCINCGMGQGQANRGAKMVNEFINQIASPQAARIQEMLTVMRAMALLGGGTSVYTSQQQANLPCIGHINEAEGMQAVADMVNYVYEKRIVPMAKKYKKDPRKAFAGISSILAIERERQLLGISDGSEAMQLAAEWMQNYADQYMKRLTQQYQYQIYPVFAGLPRQLALLGLELPGDYQEWVNKAISFMHFKIKIDFEATGHGKNNSKYHALVNGEGELHVFVSSNGCYSFESARNEGIQFTVKEVEFSSGQGAAHYQGPSSFNVPISLDVDICADAPKFSITMDHFGADGGETYVSSDGQSFRTALLQSLAFATLGSANMDNVKKDAQEVMAKANKSTQPPVIVDSAASRLRRFEHDSIYLKSDRGKADMAIINKAKKDMGFGNYQYNPASEKEVNKLHAYTDALKKRNEKIKQPGYMGSPEFYKDQQEISELKSNTNLEKVAGYAGMSISLLKMETGFKIGSQTPVDYTKKDKVAAHGGGNGGWEFGQFHITVEQMNDKGYNIK